MKKQNLIELAVKMIVAALTAFLTAITTHCKLKYNKGAAMISNAFVTSAAIGKGRPWFV